MLLLRQSFITVVLLVFINSATAKETIIWHDWSPALFDKAQQENKFILLDLEAVWCHWCHVMEHETYGNKDVIAIMNEKYLAVRVDQDANPDLSNRYGDWGWPATIVFAPDGTEIVRRRGYIAPFGMYALLKAIIDDPSPGPSVYKDPTVIATDNTQLSKKQYQHILDLYLYVYDAENGGWGRPLKYMDAGNMEYALGQAESGNQYHDIFLRQTLKQGAKLIDPVWGGLYQYSDKLDWSSPHFEKIMSFQVSGIKAFSRAYLLNQDEQYKTHALDIYKYLANKLSAPNGGFYTSQDADLNQQIDGHKFYALDDNGRNELGEPRIDKNIYSRENGWVIDALSVLYAATQDKDILKRALNASHWIVENRSNGQGGFIRSDKTKNQPFLGDTLYMGKAFLSLYSVTGDRQWLKHAEKTAQYINTVFIDNDEGGYISALVNKGAIGVFTKAKKLHEENIALLRFTNMLHHYTGNKQYQQMAEHAFSYLGSDAVVQSRYFLGELLQANDEFITAPIHITITGSKHDKNAQALFAKALTYPNHYKRVEWLDPIEGALPNPDVQYPVLSKAAAFACANKICSLPVFESDKLFEAVKRTTRSDSELESL